MRFNLFVCLLFYLFWCNFTYAQDNVDVGEFDFRITVGHGNIENPLSKRNDITLNVLPEFSYYGEKFYVENFVVGYSLVETNDFIFDVFGYINRDGFYFELDGISDITVANVFGRMPARPPINSNNQPGLNKIERKLSYMAGFNSQFFWKNSYFRLSVAQDISGVHDGQEVKFAVGYQYFWQDFKFDINLYAVNKSAKLLDYYYSIHAREWADKAVTLTNHGDINTGFRIAVTYRLNENWFINAIGEQQNLSQTIRSSYLTDKPKTFSWFTGLTYRF